MFLQGVAPYLILNTILFWCSANGGLYTVCCLPRMRPCDAAYFYVLFSHPTPANPFTQSPCGGVFFPHTSDGQMPSQGQLISASERVLAAANSLGRYTTLAQDFNRITGIPSSKTSADSLNPLLYPTDGHFGLVTYLPSTPIGKDGQSAPIVVVPQNCDPFVGRALNALPDGTTKRDSVFFSCFSPSEFVKLLTIARTQIGKIFIPTERVSRSTLYEEDLGQLKTFAGASPVGPRYVIQDTLDARRSFSDYRQLQVSQLQMLPSSVRQDSPYLIEEAPYYSIMGHPAGRVISDSEEAARIWGHSTDAYRAWQRGANNKGATVKYQGLLADLTLPKVYEGIMGVLRSPFAVLRTDYGDGDVLAGRPTAPKFL